MSKTSTAVKRKYNEKAYDRINLTVKKGQKAVITEHAVRNSESVNGFINRAIDETMKRDTNDEKSKSE